MEPPQGTPTNFQPRPDHIAEVIAETEELLRRRGDPRPSMRSHVPPRYLKGLCVVDRLWCPDPLGLPVSFSQGSPSRVLCAPETEGGWVACSKQDDDCTGSEHTCSSHTGCHERMGECSCEGTWSRCKRA